MKPNSELRVLELFTRAIELEGDERRRFLDTSCAGDAMLRRDVERMLVEDSKSGGLLDRVVLRRVGSPGPSEGAPTRVGRYAIEDEIGSGGMGTVYRAVQDEPRRVVALKTLRRNQLSKRAVQRFRFEAEVLGSLQHPGIAQIHEAGTDGADTFFIAMEFVAGARDLITSARERGLDTLERIELFLSVCDAVHHGHQRGVIHRDLKPGNLLVDERGCVKVIDFGLARVTDPGRQAITAVETEAGQVFGTLRYMSPEQLDPAADAAGVPGDVYALGVVLFELLTGELPVDLRGLGLGQAIAALRGMRPRRLGRLDPRFAGDLEWIVAKALAREPERRYASVRELAEDLRRHLRHEPVLAGPPSRTYLWRKFVRRHRAPLAAVAAVFLALALGLLRAELAVRAEVLAREEAERATQAEELARKDAEAAARAEERAREVAQLEAEVSNEVSMFLGALVTEVNAYSGGADARLSDLLTFAENRLREVQRPGARSILSGFVGQGRLNMQDPAGAEPFLSEAVALGADVFEPASPHRLRNEIVWADWLEQMGRYEESYELSSDILVRGDEVLGYRDDFYISYNLAVCASRLGRHAEAESVYQELLDRELESQQYWGNVINLTHKVGGEQMLQRRYDDGRERLEEVLSYCERMPGFELYTATAQMDLALIHLELGEAEEAVYLFELAGEAFVRRGGQPSSHVTVALGLARGAIAGGELDAAARHIANARHVVETEHGWPRLEVQCLAAEAELQAARGNRELARETAESALAAAEELAGPGGLLTAQVFETLARVTKGTPAEEGVLRRAWERFREARGVGDPETVYWRERVRELSGSG